MTIYLVRHASAGRRAAGTEDQARSLDLEGKAQAEAIATFVSASAAEAVFSSPAVRCQQTVAPAAAAFGLEVEVAEALREGYGANAAMALVRRLAGADANAVLCSHGDVIPHLIDLLALQGVAVAGRGCGKGSIWTLIVQEQVVTEARYSPPSAVAATD